MCMTSFNFFSYSWKFECVSNEVLGASFKMIDTEFMAPLKRMPMKERRESRWRCEGLRAMISTSPKYPPQVVRNVIDKSMIHTVNMINDSLIIYFSSINCSDWAHALYALYSDTYLIRFTMK